MLEAAEAGTAEVSIWFPSLYPESVQGLGYLLNADAEL